MRHCLYTTALVSCFLLSLIIFVNTIGARSANPVGNHSGRSSEYQQEQAERVEWQQAAAAIEELKRRPETPNNWLGLRFRVNPTIRSYLIHNLGPLGVDPKLVVERLQIEKDAASRRALILSLGGYTEQQLTKRLRKQLASDLLRRYRNDADAGVHSAIKWLFRNPNRKVEWNQTSALARVDQALTGKPLGSSNWYITREGQTMVVIRNTGEFMMGSPDDEEGRTADETYHRVRIPRSFAVATTEVTVAQFQRFLEANPKLESQYPDPTKDPRRGSRVMQSHSPEDDCPQIAITWYEAAQYCNWLSQQEGIQESEWVYPVNLNDIKTGMILPSNYLHRRGYRLLTEAEWEFAARASTNTSRFFGTAAELLGAYAVYSKNPPKRKNDPNDPNDPQRTSRVGQLRPNDFGLFDVYGNVWEWIHDRRVEHAANTPLRLDIEDTVLVVNDQQWRMRRGGSFSYDSSVMRSAHRGRPDGYAPNERRDSVGFRIARTYR